MKNLKKLAILTLITTNLNLSIKTMDTYPDNDRKDDIDIGQQSPSFIRSQKILADYIKKDLDKTAQPTQEQLNGWLHTAVITNHEDLVKELLAKGANPNTGFDNKTVLHYAIHKKNPAIVELLLNAGANPKTTLYGNTPLKMAVIRNSSPIVSLLLNTAETINPDTFSNLTIYQDRDMFFSRKINPEIVLMLLEKMGGPNVQDEDGLTPLHWAVLGNDGELAKTLLDAGADKNIRTNSGHTALGLSKMEKRGNNTILLLKALEAEKSSWFPWLW
jgi:ankyrin repeat protein